MNRVKKNELGFGVIELILIIVIVVLVGIVGWALYKNKHTSSHKIVTANSTKSATPTAITPEPADSRVFYDCYDANTTGNNVSTAGPITCTMNGKKYAAPTVFNKNQIDNLGRAPSAAQQLIMAIASKNFTACQTSVGSTGVVLVQANFVELGVGCVGGGGWGEYLGLNNGQWVDLGSNQVGITCSWVATYNIKQSSAIRQNGADKTCVNSDLSNGPIPL